MANASLIPTTLLIAVIIAFSFAATGRSPAAEQRTPTISLVGSDSNSHFVPLGVGKSVVIDLPRDIKDVLVADPTIANAVIRSARRAYIIGAKVGQTNVFFFDAEGQQIGGLDIAVTRDLNGLRAAIKRALPNADIQIEGLGDGIVLYGNVPTAIDSQTAFDIASRLVDDGKKVVNSINIFGRDQVMLKVTVAEVQRDVVKQLGINLNGSVRAGTSVVNFNTDVSKFTAFGQPLNSTSFSGQSGITTDPITGALSPRINATLQAMERAGVIRTLAEPTLTAISGESAYFLAGGEFPVPGNYVCDPTTKACTIQVQFKKFGVGLNFTPVVLAEGRISLKVMSEVSELSNENALTLTQSIGNNQTSSLTIPSIKTRRAETTLEIPSGGSMAMAGMIQEQTKQQIEGVPGLMQVPILGALFKSRDYVNRQTELMVLVTPYIVRAVARKDLSRPDDGFADPSDPSSVLLGRLNRIYGVAGTTEPKGAYRGNYGFILD
jgi:pilus assembly protein CpaC